MRMRAFMLVLALGALLLAPTAASAQQGGALAIDVLPILGEHLGALSHQQDDIERGED